MEKQKGLFEIKQRKPIKKTFATNKIFASNKTLAINKITDKTRARKGKSRIKYELSCGVVIFHIYKKEPQYLLLKYPTYWGFVKGIVEPGEDEEKTAFREADEEVGITDLYFIQGFRKTLHWFYRHYKTKELMRKEAVYLLARTKSWQVKISHEHENYKWCKYGEALKIMKIKATRQLLSNAHDFIMKRMGKF